MDDLGAVFEAACDIADEHRIGLAVVDDVEDLRSSRGMFVRCMLRAACCVCCICCVCYMLCVLHMLRMLHVVCVAYVAYVACL